MESKRISIIGAGTVALAALAALDAAGYRVAQADVLQPKRPPATPTEEAARIAAAEAKRARKNAKRLASNKGAGKVFVIFQAVAAARMVTVHSHTTLGGKLTGEQLVPRTLTEEQIERHEMPASECPPNSQVILVSSIRRLLGLTAAETSATASVAGLADWTTPTTVQQRMSDAVTLLCAGKRPPDDMVAGWLDRDAEDGRLQEFAIEHGPAWAQGIALLDAAWVMVDQPTEGVDHEHAAPLAVPAGMALVPVEPTPAMREAPAKDRPGFSPNVAREVWAAMLAAAPQSPQPAQQGATATNAADEGSAR